MMNAKQILVLIGSPRGEKTTSESITDYLKEKLTANGVQTMKYRAHQIFTNPEAYAAFVKQLRQSDLLMICAPLYVDGLPYPLLRTLEMLDETVEKNFWPTMKMMAVIHSGYPEPQQRKAALAVCKCFAHKMGMEWQGSLDFGMTSVIAGSPLTEKGRLTKWMRQALDKTALAIAQGQPVPDAARKLSLKRLLPLPTRLLKCVINWMTRKNARDSGLKDPCFRPYQQDCDL